MCVWTTVWLSALFEFLQAGTEDGCVVVYDTEYNTIEYLNRFDSQESKYSSSVSVVGTHCI